MGGHHGRSHCCPKKTLLYIWSSQKITWMFHSATGKIFCGQMKPQLTCLEGTHNTMCGEEKHSTPTSKPHPHCKVWWREHHGLGLLCCLRAWAACYHRWKNVFPSLSRHFAGECKAICPPIEAQQKLSRTGQRQKKVNQQNGFNRRKYAFWSGPVRVLTSTRLRCCGMTSRERFTPDILRILLNWNSFVKRNGPNLLQTDVTGLIHNYRKRLVEVIAAKGGSTSY